MLFAQVGSNVTLPLDHDEFDEVLEDEDELLGVPQVTLRLVLPLDEEELEDEVFGPHVTFMI